MANKEVNSDLSISGNVTSNSFIVLNGTSTQFLKGNGTLDSNTYSTTSHTHDYLPLSGGTLTGALSGTSSVFSSIKLTSGATNTYILTSDASGNATWQVPTDLTRVGGNLPTTVTEITDVFTIDFSVNNNFLLNANGAFSIVATITAAEVGQSGMITIINTTATTAAALPANLLTPNGALIAWDNTVGHVAILSYYIISSTQAVVNYVGNFS